MRVQDLISVKNRQEFDQLFTEVEALNHMLPPLIPRPFYQLLV